MSDFYGKMQQTQDNVSYTENGMAGYKTSGKELVDFNFAISSYRSDAKKAIADLRKVIASGESHVLKFLFYVRDAREGTGERDLFRNCLLELLKADFSDKDHVVDVIIEQTPEFGRWDDLLPLLDTEYADKVIALFKKTLKDDMAKYKEGKSISLLAKWLPSETASSKKTKRYSKMVREALGASEREYRKTLSLLRAYLDVTEVKTCANDWGSIDYNAVPSKANIKYRNAFLKHDEKRRREFLAQLNSGDKSVKVNMSVTFPHEIVHGYVNRYGSSVQAYNDTLEAYWKALKPCVGLKDTIVVRDGSGSMCSTVGNTSVAALTISSALAVYCSQFLSGTFKDKFITFSDKAKLIDLSKYGSLHTKLEKMYREDDWTSTNIENVFQLILDTAVESQLDPLDMPSTVLIISDMEFNPAVGGRGMNGGSNVFRKMSAEFKQHGYLLPKLAFWNVNSRTKTIPCRINDNGVILISGFSTNVLKMVMNGETDPYQALLKELDAERYAKIPLISFNASAPKEKKRQPTRKEAAAAPKEAREQDFNPGFLNE